MSRITDIVTDLAQPVVEQAGCELWDVEYVKEAGQWFLRIYIDKDGGVSIDDCETISRALDPILDEQDPIDTSYTFEVSSAGAERSLKRPSDFARFMDSYVEVRLYKAKNGIKEYTGNLKGDECGNVTIEYNGEMVTFEKNEVANVRLRIKL